MTNEHTCFPREPTGSNGAAVHADGFRSKTSGATRSASPWYPTAMETRNASVTEAVGGGSEHLFRHPYLSTSTRAVSVTLHVLSVVASVASVASRVSPASKTNAPAESASATARLASAAKTFGVRSTRRAMSRASHTRSCMQVVCSCVSAFQYVSSRERDCRRRRAPSLERAPNLGVSVSRFSVSSAIATPRAARSPTPDESSVSHSIRRNDRWSRRPHDRTGPSTLPASRSVESRARSPAPPSAPPRNSARLSRSARVEVRGIASRRRRGHVRGRAGERAEEVRAPARVPAGRVPPVEPRAPRRVRGRRDGASRVRRRLGVSSAIGAKHASRGARAAAASAAAADAASPPASAPGSDILTPRAHSGARASRSGARLPWRDSSLPSGELFNNKS